MMRWLAIPVAATIAVAVGTVSWQGGTPAYAGSPQLTFAVDCNTSTGGVQSSCTLAQGTVTADVVLTNGTGGSLQLAAIQFDLTASPGGTTTFVPNVVACAAPATNCNPDFDPGAAFPGGWDCSGPNPSPDINDDANADTAESRIGCFGPALTFANGASVALARITYTVSADTIYTLNLNDASAYDDSFGELGTCDPLINVAAICNDATVQIGASANTPTPTNTATPTNTSVPTNTPCVTGCATPTSLAYKTVTPTGTITVADTPAPGETTVPPPPPPPPPPPGGGSGGTTGGGGTGGIRLPDTGSGGASSGSTVTGAMALAAMAVGLLAATGLGLNMAAARRRED